MYLKREIKIKVICSKTEYHVSLLFTVLGLGGFFWINHTDLLHAVCPIVHLVLAATGWLSFFIHSNCLNPHWSLINTPQHHFFLIATVIKMLQVIQMTAVSNTSESPVFCYFLVQTNNISCLKTHIFPMLVLRPGQK